MFKLLPNKDEFREELPKNIAGVDLYNLGTYFAKLQCELKDTLKSMEVLVDGWESSEKRDLLNTNKR